MSLRSASALAILLLLVAAIDVLCMPAVFWAGDPGAWREETKAILHGRLAVDGDLAEKFGETGQYFVRNTAGAEPRWYSKYGIVNSIMALPPVLVDQWQIGRERRPGEPPDLLVFNLYQVMLSLLVCAALYRLAGRYTERLSTRVIYVIAVLYTTYLWYFQRAQSSELYQVLFYTLFFDALVSYLEAVERGNGDVGRRAHAQLVTAWTFAGLLVLTRVLFGLLVPAVLFAAAVIIWRLGSERRRRAVAREALYLGLPACAIVAVLAVVNQVRFGSPLLTGYHVWHPEMHWPAWDVWDGVRGFVLDMQGSVLWYFPVLLFAALAARRFARRRPVDAGVMLGIFALFFVVLGKTPTWRGDWTYGPRYMLFGLPVLALPFVTWIDWIVDERRRTVAWLAGATTLVTLLCSAYLTERQNRLEFFVYYRVSAPIESSWDRPVAEYFLNHHVGWICADLLAHRNRIDDLAFMKDLEARTVPVAGFDDYKRRLIALVTRENYYWRRPERRLSRK